MTPDVSGPSATEWVIVARRTTLRGGKGRLAARLIAPDANPLRPGLWVALEGDAGRERYQLEEVEAYRDRVVFRLRGVATANEASRLVGTDILLQGKDLVDLPEGTYYIFRLVGLEVTGPGSSKLGIVEGVCKTGGTDLLRVRTPDAREILIPLAQSICHRIDFQAGRIEVEVPEGLLELDGI